MKPKLVIFDCDGTLSDSRATIATSIQQAFSRQGLPIPSPREIDRRIGLSLEEFVQDLCGDREVDVAELVAHYRQHARAHLSQTGADPLFPGAIETLRRLRDEGILLAIATGKSRRGLQALLRAHDLSTSFAVLQTSDDAPSKPHPAMVEQALEQSGVSATEAVMVGDTVFDMGAAANAGVAAIGVSWGYHRTQELLAAGASCVVDDFAQLEIAVGLAPH